MLSHIEATIPETYTAEGLYRVFAAGFLPVPYLWEYREEFHRAVDWQTRVVRGAVEVVDEQGHPLAVAERIWLVVASAGLVAQ